MTKRVHIYYSGTVQGVGFRFITEALADRLGLKGWVRNLSDGRVEVLCEGEEPDLMSFISNMKNGPMKDYITSAEIEWDNSRNEFKDFAVRF